MSSAKVIHEAAMEFYDMANQAKIKGDLVTWREQLEKAYVLEKEAALTMPELPHNAAWRYILLRGAGWLAFQAGFFQEAKKLAEVGLAGNPPALEKQQFLELKAAAAEKMKNATAEPDASFPLSGVFTSADLLQSRIVIRENGKGRLHEVTVPDEKIRELARLFLGDVVQVKTKNQAGVEMLEGMRRAA